MHIVIPRRLCNVISGTVHLDLETRLAATVRISLHSTAPRTQALADHRPLRLA